MSTRLESQRARKYKRYTTMEATNSRTASYPCMVSFGDFGQGEETRTFPRVKSFRIIARKQTNCLNHNGWAFCLICLRFPRVLR
eukprot:5285994-Amphidinium_carterae.1